jgi:hypothetical protein
MGKDSTPSERWPCACEVAKRLKARKIADGKWLARCPAHDDEKPSLSIGEGRDGRLLLFCFAGCSFAEVCDALVAQGVLPRFERRRSCR